MVDCSHANSGKKYEKQQVAWRSVIDQRTAGNRHLIGLMLLFTGTGVLLTQGKEGALRKPALMFHGIGLFLLLLGGFGMLAKYAKTGPEIYSYTNVWVLLKLVIWLFFGVVIVLAKKGILEGKMGWWVCLAAGTIATWAALFKPFL